MKGYVYKITNKINGKSYIGLTRQPILARWQKHCSTSGCHAMSSAIKKYGKEAFDIESVFESESLQDLKKKESEYIVKFDTLFPNGYNLTSGGEHSSPTNEVRQRIAQALTGKERPLKVREKLSRAHLGKKNGPCSEETRNKISMANTGRKFSKEHKKKLSLAKTGKKQPAESVEKRTQKTRKSVFCVETGQIFKSIMDASRYLNIDNSSISKVCRKMQKNVKGYTFEFLERE